MNKLTKEYFFLNLKLFGVVGAILSLISLSIYPLIICLIAVFLVTVAFEIGIKLGNKSKSKEIKNEK